MVKKLDGINTDARRPTKANPYAIMEKEIVSKSIRIYEKDFDRVKEMSYKEKIKLVEVIEQAVDLLYKSKGYDNKDN